MIVSVRIPNIKGYALVQRGDDFYITPAKGFSKNEEVFIDNEDDLRKMPSLLYALAEMPELPEAIQFVKENW